MYLWSPKTHKVRYDFSLAILELKAEEERFSPFFK